MENILDDNRIETPSKKNFFLFLIHYLFTGGGMLYMRPKSPLKWLYFVTFWYSWLAIINIILVMDYRTGIPALEHFHNKNGFGAMSIIIGWFICYFILAANLLRPSFRKGRKNLFLFFFMHFFLGSGMLYSYPNKIRKWFYFILFWGAWGTMITLMIMENDSFGDIFYEYISRLFYRPENTPNIGYYIIAGWLVSNLVAFIDITWIGAQDSLITTQEDTF